MLLWALRAGVSLPSLRAECWGVELLCLTVLSWAVVQCTTLPMYPVGARGLHSCHVVALRVSCALALIISEPRPLPKCYLAIWTSGRCLFTSHVVFYWVICFILLLRNALYILGANCWQCVFTCFLSWGCSFVEQGGFPDVNYRRQEVVGLHAGGKLWRLWPSLSECHGPSPVLWVRQGFLES